MICILFIYSSIPQKGFSESFSKKWKQKILILMVFGHCQYWPKNWKLVQSCCSLLCYRNKIAALIYFIYVLVQQGYSLKVSIKSKHKVLISMFFCHCYLKKLYQDHWEHTLNLCSLITTLNHFLRNFLKDIYWSNIKKCGLVEKK